MKIFAPTCKALSLPKAYKGSAEMEGHMMWHFTTLDTTNAGGSGHLGHH